jgi:hypothetical protein
MENKEFDGYKAVSCLLKIEEDAMAKGDVLYLLPESHQSPYYSILTNRRK